MFQDVTSLLSVLLRFGHIAFGIIWIGHLYFLNLVNVPFQGDVDKELKPKITPKLLFDQTTGGLSNRGLWMIFGALIGTIMWFNVWFVIWPRQKLILGGMA